MPDRSVTSTRDAVESGETLVFVHGFGVNGRLWDGTAASLAGEHRCIVPDWPMGSHAEAMHADADVTPPGCARLISEFLRRLDLEDVTIVGNDSGGAVSQMLVTRHPDRIARLVLTNCDCFEKFPPQPFKAMFKAAQAPGGAAALARSMQIGAIRRGPLAYGGLTVKPIDETLLRSFVDPLLRGPRRPARRHALRRRRRHARHDGCRRQAARPADPGPARLGRGRQVLHSGGRTKAGRADPGRPPRRDRRREDLRDARRARPGRGRDRELRRREAGGRAATVRAAQAGVDR